MIASAKGSVRFIAATSFDRLEIAEPEKKLISRSRSLAAKLRSMR